MQLDKGIFSPDYCLEDRYISDCDKLGKLVNSIREMFGYKIALTMGSFDLLHIGHARYIREAKLRADLLIVGVDSDEKVQKRKGSNRPVVPQDERIEMLAHTRYADIITLKRSEDEKWKLIKVVRPDVLIISERMDYDGDEQKVLESLCGEIVLLESQATTSSSAKIRKLQTGVLLPALQEMERALVKIKESME